MPDYKLTYFNARYRAELARWIMSAAGQKWEDVRLTDEKFAEIKSSLPFGQLPLLETEGLVLCQSNAIARFLAKRFGFAGKTEAEQAKVDMIVYCVGDMINPWVDYGFPEPEVEQFKPQFKQIWDKKRPIFLANFEKILKSNNGGDGFLVGDQITFADMDLSVWLSYIEFDPATYPKLAALKARTESYPGIAKWISERPDTE